VRLVVALGGNALLRPGEAPEAEVQRANLRAAARGLAALAAEHELVITHGNGPQIGWLALQAEAAGGRPDPLDVLGAESEALIGYLIEQELSPLLPGRELATLLTQVEVDPADPAFRAPSKPIGPLYDEAQAAALARERGWSFVALPGGRRRVVPSPEPRRMRELAAIRRLVDAGVLVICAGGGGIPVVATPGGGLRGVEAVIDKDLCAALLGEEVAADALLLLTDVEFVYEDWPTPCERPIRTSTPAALRARSFAPGSMAPKVEAACRFVERGGRVAAIGALAQAARVLAGEAGTRITPERGAGRPRGPGEPQAPSRSTRAAASSTAVPLKKSGFMPPCRRTALRKEMSAKSSSPIRPSSTSSKASATTSRMSTTSKWPMSEPSIARSLAPKGFRRVSKASEFMRSSPSQPK
jgi:carbamate kinase